MFIIELGIALGANLGDELFDDLEGDIVLRSGDADGIERGARV